MTPDDPKDPSGQHPTVPGTTPGASPQGGVVPDSHGEFTPVRTDTPVADPGLPAHQWRPTDVDPKPGADVPARGTAEGPGRTVGYHIEMDPVSLDLHPNGMILTPRNSRGEALRAPVDYYSVGGGFVMTGDELRAELAG